jgi:pseudouridine kinase
VTVADTFSPTAPRVIVAGGINVDLVVAPTEALVRGTSNPGAISIHAGGVARNIAEFLARLKVPVALVGRVGHEALSRWVVTATKTAGVDVGGVDEGEGTVGFYVTIQEDGDLGTAISDLSATERITPDRLVSALSRYGHTGRNCPEILILDCNLLPETLQAALSWANQRDVFVVVEPVSRHKARRLVGLRGRVDVVTPNVAEERELRREAARGRSLPEIRWWVVTRGADGAVLRDGREGVPEKTYPGRTVRPVNTNGAGDAFVAGMVWAVLRGLKSQGPVTTVDWDEAIAAGLAAGRRTVLSVQSVPEDISETALLSDINEAGYGT